MKHVNRSIYNKCLLIPVKFEVTYGARMMSHKLFIYIHVLYRCLVSKEALKDFQDISLEMEMY